MFVIDNVFSYTYACVPIGGHISVNYYDITSKTYVFFACTAVVLLLERTILYYISCLNTFSTDELSWRMGGNVICGWSFLNENIFLSQNQLAVDFNMRWLDFVYFSHLCFCHFTRMILELLSWRMQTKLKRRIRNRSGVNSRFNLGLKWLWNSTKNMNNMWWLRKHVFLT